MLQNKRTIKLTDLRVLDDLHSGYVDQLTNVRLDRVVRHVVVCGKELVGQSLGPKLDQHHVLVGGGVSDNPHVLDTFTTTHRLIGYKYV